MPVELLDTANLEKVASDFGAGFSLPNSVFVSPGPPRALSHAGGYPVHRNGRISASLGGRQAARVILYPIGAVAAAALFSGSRTALIFVSLTAVVMALGLLWGAPWRSRMVHNIFKVIAWSAGITTIGLSLAVMLYPVEVGSRVAFYAETLNPFSLHRIEVRAISYPIENLATAFDDPNWLFGNGRGPHRWACSMSRGCFIPITGESGPSRARAN